MVSRPRQKIPRLGCFYAFEQNQSLRRNDVPQSTKATNHRVTGRRYLACSFASARLTGRGAISGKTHVRKPRPQRGRTNRGENALEQTHGIYANVSRAVTDTHRTRSRRQRACGQHSRQLPVRPMTSRRDAIAERPKEMRKWRRLAKAMRGDSDASFVRRGCANWWAR